MSGFTHVSKHIQTVLGEEAVERRLLKSVCLLSGSLTFFKMAALLLFVGFNQGFWYKSFKPKFRSDARAAFPFLMHVTVSTAAPRILYYPLL